MITQKEARELFGPQPEPQPEPEPWPALTAPRNTFYLDLPGINGWHPPIPNTEDLDLLDEIPPLLPPTLELCVCSTATARKTNGLHSDDNIFLANLQKPNLDQGPSAGGGEQSLPNRD